MLEDVFKQVDMAGVTTCVMWTDVGRHFRARQFLAYWGVSMLQRGVSTVLKHWPEAHGKSLCDGKFGQLVAATCRAALRTVLSDAYDLQRVWEAEHKEDMIYDPSCVKTMFVVFMPPTKRELPPHTLDDKAMDLEIQS
eukprot:9122857-Karenia_brevis.AAC.1